MVSFRVFFGPAAPQTSMAAKANVKHASDSQKQLSRQCMVQLTLRDAILLLAAGNLADKDHVVTVALVLGRFAHPGLPGGPLSHVTPLAYLVRQVQ